MLLSNLWDEHCGQTLSAVGFHHLLVLAPPQTVVGPEWLTF